MITPGKYDPYDFANRRHIGPSPEEMAEMFIVEEDSGTYTGPIRRHDGYYAGDFTRTPMCTASEISALTRLRPLTGGVSSTTLAGS